jgi:hypothetical protein
MCGPTAPTALRRRSSRSSDRGRGFVFGSSLGRPGEHDDCLALSRRSSLLEMPEPRAAKGPPPGGASGSPIARVLRDSGGGFDAARSLFEGEGAREWRADVHPSGCDRLRRAVSPHVRGQPRKDGEKELEPPAAALRSERWVAHESLRRCVAMTSATERLRASDRRGGSPLGADPLALHFEARCGVRPRCLLRVVPEPTAIDCGRPFGDSRTRSHGARQGRNTLPSPHVRVGGRRSGSGRQAKRPARAGRRDARGSVGNESIQSPREHRAVARRQRRTNATDSSVEEGPEVESSTARRGDTQAGAVRTARGHASR